MAKKYKNAIEIHRSKQPNRPHFVPDWAMRRGYKNQAELVEALGADKSVVNRWYHGASPGEDWQERLVDLFQCKDRDALFRHPDEDGLRRLLKDRSSEEVTRMIQTLEAAFAPAKTK